MDRTTESNRIVTRPNICRISFLVAVCLTLLVGCAGVESSVTDVPLTDTMAPTETSIPPTETPIPVPSPTPFLSSVEVIRDMFYVPDGLSEQRLDIYSPTSGDEPFPVLFMIHGGGGRKEQMAFWGRTFAEKGYAVVSIDHRQWPDHDYPAHVEDAFCALAWVHANAVNYNFDTRNVFAMGHSAGGTLVAMLGVVDDPSRYTKECPHALPEDERVQGIIPFTGIFDYATAIEQSFRLEEYAIELLGGGLDEVPEVWAEASAATWVDGSEPPFLLIHGAADSNISPSQSRDFIKLLEGSGVEVELLLIPEAGHEQITGSEQSLQAVEEFLAQLLRQ